MSNHEIIQSQIKKKEAEIQQLEKKLNDAKVYIQALRDVLHAAETEQAESAAAEGTIREGSAVDQARRIILNAGKPLHLNEILEILGKEVTRETKASLNGSLSAYVRRGEVFTRPKASTYGLKELEATKPEDERQSASHTSARAAEPPPGFGDESIDLDDDIPF